MLCGVLAVDAHSRFVLTYSNSCDPHGILLALLGRRESSFEWWVSCLEGNLYLHSFHQRSHRIQRPRSSTVLYNRQDLGFHRVLFEFGLAWLQSHIEPLDLRSSFAVVQIMGSHRFQRPDAHHGFRFGCFTHPLCCHHCFGGHHSALDQCG